MTAYIDPELVRDESDVYRLEIHPCFRPVRTLARAVCALILEKKGL